ncbi:MAG: hypothetical protein ACRD3D_09395, partial [Terriglobia bacterium]
ALRLCSGHNAAGSASRDNLRRCVLACLSAIRQVSPTFRLVHFARLKRGWTSVRGLSGIAARGKLGDGFREAE